LVLQEQERNKMKTLTIPVVLTAFGIAACQPLFDTDRPAGAATQLPEVMQGRWGLTENDCDPTRDDNKGLMAAEATTLRFYESRAVLTGVVDSTTDSFTGDYTFTGEGQTWQRRITFETGDSGMILMRSDEGEGAFDGTYRYLNCEAV